MSISTVHAPGTSLPNALAYVAIRLALGVAAFMALLPVLYLVSLSLKRNDDILAEVVDTRQRLFDAPANLFVAGFIGSPAMDLVEAYLVQDVGLTFRFGRFRLPVLTRLVERFDGLTKRIGQGVVIGLRPHSFENARLRLDPALPRDGIVARATESLGSEVNVIFDVDAPSVHIPGYDEAGSALDREVEEERELVTGAADQSVWTARVSAKTDIRSGASATLTVDLNSLHVLDPVTGRALWRA